MRFPVKMLFGLINSPLTIISLHINNTEVPVWHFEIKVFFVSSYGNLLIPNAGFQNVRLSVSLFVRVNYRNDCQKK